MEQNYFEFFEIQPSFYLDEDLLKKKFYANSRKYHPDFFAMESEEKQEEVLALSTLNNKAYQVLKDFDYRMFYLLKQEAVIEEEGKNELPQMFLMEMMEINEALMELQMDFNEDEYQKVTRNISEMENVLLKEVEPDLLAYAENESECDLNKIKDYYFKKKYLLRIKENLDKFASA